MHIIHGKFHHLLSFEFHACLLCQPDKHYCYAKGNSRGPNKSLNPLAPGGCSFNSQMCDRWTHVLKFMSTSREIAFRSMPPKTLDDASTLLQTRLSSVRQHDTHQSHGPLVIIFQLLQKRYRIIAGHHWQTCFPVWTVFIFAINLWR